MALKKEINLATGYTAEYFRVNKITQNKLVVKFTLDLYKDKAARDDGKKPIAINYRHTEDGTDVFTDLYTLQLTESEMNNGCNIYEKAYLKLKTYNFFSNSEDV